MNDIAAYLSSNEYPGRGIALGLTPDMKKAFIAYFIMGRSVNSRNRVFVTDGEGIRTQAFDASKMKDPSLIIYAPVRVLGNKTIVTNGDQTDTVYDGIAAGKSFAESLEMRRFEPDMPNYTPRISGIVTVTGGSLRYDLSILKSANGDCTSCRRYLYSYIEPQAGVGQIIHTYEHNGDPIPSFCGEPRDFSVPSNDIRECGDLIWNSLNADNKVSLFVRTVSLEDLTHETLIYNKNI